MAGEASEREPEAPPSVETFEPTLRAAIGKLPRPVRFRAENAFTHIDRALALLSIDREMASFRAITGEEEAASAIIRAVQLQGYPLADRLSLRDHRHKAAVYPFMAAVRARIAKGEPTLSITLDASKPRVDVQLPLAQFGIQPPGPALALQLSEPLDVVSARKGSDGEETPERWTDELASIATGAKFEAVLSFIKDQANARNTLLYASDGGKPKSKATRLDITHRKRRIIVALMVAIIILQTPAHQALVTAGVEVLLDILGKLPNEAGSPNSLRTS